MYPNAQVALLLGHMNFYSLIKTQIQLESITNTVEARKSDIYILTMMQDIIGLSVSVGSLIVCSKWMTCSQADKGSSGDEMALEHSLINAWTTFILNCCIFFRAS